jgi:hypothetical protein
VDFQSAGTLLQLWTALHRLVSYGLISVESSGWGDLVQPGVLPTPQILIPLAVAILLMPVVARWSGSLFRLTIIVMALLVPVCVVLPVL